jgi:OOP family OmpA-OmpF porin
MTIRSGMPLRSVVPALMLILPCVAHGQPVSGFYLGAGSGLNFMPTQVFNATIDQSALAGPTGRVLTPASRYKVQSRSDFYTGGAAVASAGYGFGNGVRLELEANYRFNGQQSGMVRPGVDVREQKFGVMANALFDLDIGSPAVFPYFGAGGGVQRVDRAYGPHSVRQPAYQAIAGLSVPVPWVAGLSLTLEYRFLGLVDVNGTAYRVATRTSPAIAAAGSYENDMSHSLMVGVRYTFSALGR